MPFLESAAIDGRVWLFTFALCLLTGVLCGLVPSRQAFKVDLASTLRQGGRGASGGMLHHRLRQGLIVGEIALAVALLMGEGLLLRTFQNLRSYQPGFNPSNVTVMTTSVRGPRYASEEQRGAFLRELVDDVRRMPGIVDASASNDYPPLVTFNGQRFSIAGQPVSPGHEPHAIPVGIEPRYFETLGIPLIEGRVNSGRDTTAAPRVAVISQSLARRWFPEGNAVGQLVAFDRDTAARRIVGVVGDVVSAGVDPTPQPVIYMPYAQSAGFDMNLVLRTRGEPAAIVRGVRDLIVSRDRMLPVYDVRTLDDVLTDSRWVSRFTMTLLGVFAVLSVALVAAGTYAVLAFIVSQRTQEIGIRMALGASSGDILRMIVRRGVQLTFAGAALGTLGFAWGSTALATMLFGVSTFDPVIYVTVLAAVFVITLLACYVPARSAARVPPLTALRRQ